MLDIPSSERIAVLIPADYYCDECRIFGLTALNMS